MSAEERLWKVYKTIHLYDKAANTTTMAIAIRFCDENAGNLEFMYSNRDRYRQCLVIWQKS
jgi:hypothetical protein